MSADALIGQVWETQWVRFDWPSGVHPFLIPNKPYNIISLDPGQTTGIAHTLITPERLGVRSMRSELYQYNWPDNIGVIWGFLKHADIIVCEDYRVYADSVRGRANTWKRPVALRIIGACEVVQYVEGATKIPLEFFSSAQTKEVSNSTLQRVWGELPLTKTGRSKAPYRHGIDAMRPLFLYFARLRRGQ